MPHNLNREQIISFQRIVLDFYAAHKRAMPWRQPERDGSYDPYKIMVSEIMLQQTQVNRATPKYLEFIGHFPTIHLLAAADLATVLQVWSGLGYNRRAKFLWQAAQMVNGEYNGVMPKSATVLQRLPGIGVNTAAAIMAYAYDAKVIFIETNIRTVYIHHFFSNQQQVTDAEILLLVKQTLPKGNVREWYYGLMDYGANLKATVGNVGRSAKAYNRQAPFKGSLRFVRGQVLKELSSGPLSFSGLRERIDDERLAAVCAALEAEHLIHLNAHTYFLG